MHPKNNACGEIFYGTFPLRCFSIVVGKSDSVVDVDNIVFVNVRVCIPVCIIARAPPTGEPYPEDNPATWGNMTSTGHNWIPEFPSFFILPLFMTATLLTIIVYRRKRNV